MACLNLSSLPFRSMLCQQPADHGISKTQSPEHRPKLMFPPRLKQATNLKPDPLQSFLPAPSTLHLQRLPCHLNFAIIYVLQPTPGSCWWPVPGEFSTAHLIQQVCFSFPLEGHCLVCEVVAASS
jgi:hypothetical protein